MILAWHESIMQQTLYSLQATRAVNLPVPWDKKNQNKTNKKMMCFDSCLVSVFVHN